MIRFRYPSLTLFALLLILLISPCYTIAQKDAVDIAGHVYLDHNRNGFEDGLDFGYPAVAVRVYADVNDDHVWDEEDPELGMAVSDARGHFSVPDLPRLPMGYFAVLDRDDLPDGAILNPGKVYFQPETAHCLELGFQAQPSICYLVGDGSTPDSLMVMNTVSGRAVPFGGNLGTRYIEAVCLLPGGTILFAVDKGRFGKINLKTGRFVAYSDSIGTARGAEGPVFIEDTDGLTFDPIRNKLFASSRRPDAHDILYQIDTLTGRFLPDAFGTGRDYLIMNGDHGISDVDDIAVSPINGMIYGISNFGHSESANLLVIIDPQTGNSYLLDTLRYEGNRLQDVEGLGFNNIGTLFASTGSNAGELSNTLFNINPVSANATKVGVFEVSSDYESCDCMIARPNEIRGRVFEDLNDNRVWDEGEKGLAGIYVYISPDKRQQDPTLQLVRMDSVLTDEAGRFSWKTLTSRDFVLRIDEKRIASSYAFTGGRLKSVSFQESVGGEVSETVSFGLKHNSFLAEWIDFVSEVPVAISTGGEYVASTDDKPDPLMPPTLSVSLLSPDEMKPDNGEMKRLSRGNVIFSRLQILETGAVTKGESPYVESKYSQHIYRMGIGKATVKNIIARLPGKSTLNLENQVPTLNSKTCNLQICNASRTILLTIRGR